MAEVNRTEIDLPKVAPVVTGEDPAADIKAVADRVDRVLTSLKDQMKNFEAADSSEIGGVPASSVISGSRSMYYQTFEDDIEEAWTLAAGSISGLSYTNNGQAGGRAVRTTNKAVTLVDNVNIAFDPSRLYRIRSRARKISGTNRAIHVGVECFAADGTTSLGLAYVCAKEALTLTAWTVFTGYFQDASGVGDATTPYPLPSSPRYLHADTRYIRPFFALSVGADDEVAEIDYITLEVLTETSESNVIVTKVGGRNVSYVASTVKDGGGVATDQVDTNALEDDAVTGGKVASATLSADNMGTLTGGDLTINFAATGANPVLDHTAFSLNADGSAVFSGTVSATSFTGTTLTMDGAVNIEGGTGDAVVSLYASSGYGVIELGNGYLDNDYGFRARANSLILEDYGSDDVTFEIDLDVQVNEDLQHDGPNLGFYGTTAIAQQTGVAVTAGGVHAALVALGLITA